MARLLSIRKKGEEFVEEQGYGLKESAFTPDEQILDPNSPLAVQIPEGSGADASEAGLRLAETLAEGHVEAKFGTAAAPLPVTSSADPKDNEHVRAVGDDSGAEHKPVPVSERVETPEVHSEPAQTRRRKSKSDDK